MTVSVTAAECVRLPLVPVRVNVNVPRAVPFAVLTVRVEDPDPVTDEGAKLPVAWRGNPLTLKVTVPVNPPDGVTVTV